MKNWYNLSPDELKAVVNSPKNSGVVGSAATFIVVMANVLPLALKNPVRFMKTYVNTVFTNFVSGK